MLVRKIALILVCLAALGLQACATSSGFSPMSQMSESGYDSDTNTGAGGY